MDSYKSSSFLKCVCCGVAILFFSAEIGPSVYYAFCGNCHDHIGHLSKHTHQEDHRPSNPGSGERAIMVGTSTTSTGTLTGYFL